MGVHCIEVDYLPALELGKRRLEHEREAEAPLAYNGQVVTTPYVDFLIWDEKAQLLPAPTGREAGCF